MPINSPAATRRQGLLQNAGLGAKSPGTGAPKAPGIKKPGGGGTLKPMSTPSTGGITKAFGNKKLKKEPGYSKGRSVTATIGGGYHAPFAAKRGKKIRSTVKAGVGTIAGGTAGSIGATIATRGKSPGAQALGGLGGGLGGSYAAFRDNNKRGYYKKQDPSVLKKNDSTSAFGIDHG